MGRSTPSPLIPDYDDAEAEPRYTIGSPVDPLDRLPAPESAAAPPRAERRRTRRSGSTRVESDRPAPTREPDVEPDDVPTFTISSEPVPLALAPSPPPAPISTADAAYASYASSATAPRRHDVSLDESRIDPDVQKVLRRLSRHGFEAYLVGGCVRDLLLERTPKDFDVATSARPEEVRDLFRNSRIIGRRFRLVHVLFQGGKVIEVATFRRNPKDDADESAELLIRSDNVFGVASEDAMRRDFTMNALFYDIDARQILDWVGGMEDVERRVVHTIGDPETRFREDPVRILRALKFAGRLGFAITPDVYDAIVFCREALALAARPRLSEEILRLLRGGQARRTIYLAWETGVLDVLLPELSSLLYDEGSEDGPGARQWRLLEYIDRRTNEMGPLDDTVLWTLLLLEPLKEACDGARDRSAAVAEFLEPLIERLAISRRYADGIRRIIGIMPRLASGRAGRFARTELFQAAVDVAYADLATRGESTHALEKFRSQPHGHRRR